MGRVSLPDGVAPTNDKSANDELSGVVVPDTATPALLHTGERAAQPAVVGPERTSAQSTRFYRFEEGDEDDDDDDDERKKKRRNAPVDTVHGVHAPGPVSILVAIGLVLAALAAYVVARNRPEPLPLCSEQPDWNQYNCRAG